MARYLDFEDEKWQKGYELFQLTKENCRANVGKKICFLLRRDYDKYRGYMRVSYGVIQGVRYSQLILENDNSIDIRNVLEAGIEINQPCTPTGKP